MRHQQVVADDLQLCARRVGEAREAVQVVLGQRVLDRDDRIALDPAQQHLDHAVGIELARFQRQPVAAATAELGGRDVERDGHLRAGT